MPILRPIQQDGHGHKESIRDEEEGVKTMEMNSTMIHTNVSKNIQSIDNTSKVDDVSVAINIVPTVSLKRTLGWLSLTSLGVGSTIGAGIFVLVGLVAHDLCGPAITLSFVVAAVACLLTGLCYAEFASVAHTSGSAFAYTRHTMGQFLAWIIGWDLILEYTVAGQES